MLDSFHAYLYYKSEFYLLLFYLGELEAFISQYV